MAETFFHVLHSLEVLLVHNIRQLIFLGLVFDIQRTNFAISGLEFSKDAVEVDVSQNFEAFHFVH